MFKDFEGKNFLAQLFAKWDFFHVLIKLFTVCVILCEKYETNFV